MTTLPADGSRRLGFALLAAGSLLLAACASEPEAPKSDPPRAVRVAAPTAAPAEPPVHVVGRLALRDEQQLAFRVPGIVAEVAVRAGESVESGQVLARLDTTDVDAAVEEAEAAMAKAFVCKAAEWVTREALQIHGGYGYAEEYEISRLYVDARVLSIFEGADETLCLKLIARRLLS